MKTNVAKAINLTFWIIFEVRNTSNGAHTYAPSFTLNLSSRNYFWNLKAEQDDRRFSITWNNMRYLMCHILVTIMEHFHNRMNDMAAAFLENYWHQDFDKP